MTRCALTQNSSERSDYGTLCRLSEILPLLLASYGLKSDEDQLTQTSARPLNLIHEHSFAADPCLIPAAISSLVLPIA